jgi:uncharacterized protein YjiS (DUF1127 family)
MMTIETVTYPTASAATRTRPLMARVWAWLARASERRSIKQSYAKLLEADEHILRDIGLTRHDVALLLDEARRI